MSLNFRIGRTSLKIKRSAEISTTPPAKMPPVPGEGDTKKMVEDYIGKNKVMVFSKSTCPFCTRVSSIFSRNVEILPLVLFESLFILAFDFLNNIDIQNRQTGCDLCTTSSGAYADLVVVLIYYVLVIRRYCSMKMLASFIKQIEGQMSFQTKYPD